MLLLAVVLPTLLQAQPEAIDWRFLGLEGRIIQKLRFHDGYLFATTDDGVYRKALAADDTLRTRSLPLAQLLWHCHPIAARAGN